MRLPLPAVASPPTRIEGMVLVVGSGLAGLAAALEAARYGAKSIIVEATSRLGGFSRFFKGYDAGEKLKKLISKVLDEPKIAILYNSMYIGSYPEGHIVVTRDGALLAPHDTPVVYSGGSEAPPPITRNNDLPGVVSAGYGLELVVESGYKPRRVVVLGQGYWAGLAAEKIAESLPLSSKVYLLVRRKWASGIFFEKYRSNIEYIEYEYLESITGRDRVRGVKIDNNYIEADIVVSALEEYPDANQVLGVGYKYTTTGPRIHIKEPETDREWIRQRDNLIPAGSILGYREPIVVEESGRRAGVFAAYLLGRAKEEDIEYQPVIDIASEEKTKKFSEAPQWLSEDIEGLQFIDYENDLVVDDILREYKSTSMLEEIPRISPIEGGRFSYPEALQVVAKYNSVEIDEEFAPRVDPPYIPVPISSLAIITTELEP